MDFKHIGLFEGIGGFSLAARWMGWETIAWCEWNEFCQKILTHHFPKAKQHGNIKETDFSIYRGQCDILTGGFPCQPYSQAGKRLGKEDDRHLWPEMLRAIREIQPGYVVGENVSGLTNWNGGMVFDEVQADLENEGYEVLPFLLPACAVNAPHRRDRIWFVAYSFAAWERRNQWQKENESNVTADTNGYGNRNIGKQNRETDSIQKFDRAAICSREPTGTITRLTPNTYCCQSGEIRGNLTEMCGFPVEKCRTENSATLLGGNYSKIATHPNNKGLQGSKINRGFTGIRQNGNEQLAGCVPSNWENFPTQSPLCGRDDGISNRVDRIKALGNAIVPQVALQIFKAIEQFNLTKGAR